MRLRFLPAFLGVLLMTSTAVHAQLHFMTNNGTITITGFTGSGVVNIPSSTNSHTVVSIAGSAFAGNDGITGVIIPDTVTSIGTEAFELCTNLLSATIPNSVTNLGDEQFYECYSLASVTLGTNITSIKDYDFFRCYDLTNVSIPNSVTVIQTEAFYECTSLTNITIPASVTNIQTGAFEDCSSLLGIYFLGNAPTLANQAFIGVNATTARAYYLPETTGWGSINPNSDLPPLVLLNMPLQITDLSVQAGGFGFTITGTNQQLIVVEAATDLDTANWQPLKTNTLTGTSTNFIDVQWKSFPDRYYRLSSP